jgi:hypothetical protein
MPIEKSAKANRSIYFIIDRSKFISQRKIDHATCNRMTQGNKKFDRANIDRSTVKFDRAISNLLKKSANIDTIFVRFKIQTQVVRLK